MAMLCNIWCIVVRSALFGAVELRAVYCAEQGTAVKCSAEQGRAVQCGVVQCSVGQGIAVRYCAVCTTGGSSTHMWELTIAPLSFV